MDVIVADGADVVSSYCFAGNAIIFLVTMEPFAVPFIAAVC